MRSAPHWTHNMRSAEREGNEKSEPRDPDNCSSQGREKKDEKQKQEKDARRRSQQYTNELCEILSSDDSNQQIEQDTDNFIIVELISYIGGNSRIMTYYPSTRGSKSGQNKYLHHFYSKKRIKLYLCLHKRSNEIYIYEVESRKVRRRETPPGSGACAAAVPEAISIHGDEMSKVSAFLHSAKVKSEPPSGDAPPRHNDEHNPIVNEFTSSCKEEPTHDCKSGKYNVKVEDKAAVMLSENPNLGERCTKKMVVTKLFDSVHCSYDFSTIEFTKFNNPDDKTLNSLKSILEQKINKGERGVSHKGDAPTGDAQIDSCSVDGTFPKGIHPGDHSCGKADEMGKNVTHSGDNDNACDSQVKILFLHFREPADIYMNQFAAFDQGNEETCTKEINGFLKDEQQRHIELQCAKAKRTNNYGSQIKQITNDQIEQSFLQSYESDVSIYSNDLYFSDTQVVTGENEPDINEKKRKKNFPLFTRSHLKIKWLLLNLNLTKEEEAVVQKYVLSKKANILRSSKSTHECNDLHSSFYKTRKKSNGEHTKSHREEESHFLKGDTTSNGKPYPTRSTRQGNSQPSQQNKNNTERRNLNEAHHTHLSMNDQDHNYQNENTIKEKVNQGENKLMFTFKLEDDAVKTRLVGDLHHEPVSVEDRISCQGGAADHAAEVDPAVLESDASVEPVLYNHTSIHPTDHEAHSKFIPSVNTSKGNTYHHDDATTCQDSSRPSKICSSYSYLDQGSQTLYDPATDDNEEDTQKGRKRKIEQVENANEVQNKEQKNFHVLSEVEKYDDTFPEIRNSECEIVTPEVEAPIGRCQVKDVSSTSNGASKIEANNASNDAANDTSNDSLASGSGNSNVTYISETDSRYRQCGDSVEEILPRGDEQQQFQGCATDTMNGSITLQCDGFVGSFGGYSDGEGCLKGDACRADQEGANGASGVSGDDPYRCHAERPDKTTPNSAPNGGCNGKDGLGALFLKHKVGSLFDVIKVICCNFMRHFKYTSKLKFYITTFLNFSKIEKTKLQFMQKERILDTHLLKMYVNKKTEDVKNAWKINTYKMDPHNLFRLGKFKYIDDSIIDFFHNYIYSFVLKNDKRKKNDIYIFNTFFYKKIELYEDSCKAYMSTNRWIQKLDRKVYEYTYVFVPINISNTHWSLVLLYFPFNDKQEGEQEEKIYSQKGSTPSEEDSPKSSMTSERRTPSECNQPRGEDPPPNHLHTTLRSKSCESYFSERGVLSESKQPKINTALLRNYLQGQDNLHHHHEKEERQSCKNTKSSSDCGDQHLGKIPPKEDMKNLLNDTNKTGSTRTCNDTSSKMEDQEKNENAKVAYMIYLDSLFPSIRGNKILHKLKKYLEHMLQRDYASSAGVATTPGVAPAATTNATTNVTANATANATDDKPSTAAPPRIFFKFVYPNVIPKQTNTYDCGIYIIQFVLHLCLNKHLVESELIKSCLDQGKSSPGSDRFRFNLHNNRRDVGGSYSRSCVGKPTPWFSPKDISLKRKQMKKMLLYMKNVVDWKSDRHIQALNLLFLKSHSVEGRKAKVEDSS
ncbi:Uncharacterized protein PCOAH_00002090, partial [Plasmodium coatneyi]